MKSNNDNSQFLITLFTSTIDREKKNFSPLPDHYKEIIKAFASLEKPFIDFNATERRFLAEVFSYSGHKKMWDAIVPQPFISMKLFFDYMDRLYKEEKDKSTLGSNSRIGVLQGYTFTCKSSLIEAQQAFLKKVGDRNFQDLSPLDKDNMVFLLVTYSLKIQDYDNNKQIKQFLNRYLEKQDSKALESILTSIETYQKLVERKTQLGTSNHFVDHYLKEFIALQGINANYPRFGIDSDMSDTPKKISELINKQAKAEYLIFVRDLKKCLADKCGKFMQKAREYNEKTHQANDDTAETKKITTFIDLIDTIKSIEVKMSKNEINPGEAKKILNDKVNNVISASEKQQSKTLFGAPHKFLPQTKSRIATHLKEFLQTHEKIKLPESVTTNTPKEKKDVTPIQGVNAKGMRAR